MHTHHFIFLCTQYPIHNSHTCIHTTPLCVHIHMHTHPYAYTSYHMHTHLFQTYRVTNSYTLCHASCSMLAITVILSDSIFPYFCTLVLIRRMFAPCVCVCVCVFLLIVVLSLCFCLCSFHMFSFHMLFISHLTFIALPLIGRCQTH